MSVQSPTIRSLLLVLCLLFLANCGRIYSGDLAVDYANAGKMTQLSFTFMLSNSINSDDYLKVALPFPFHSQLTPAVPAMEGLSSPSLLTVTYQAIDPVLQTLGTAYNTFVLTETIDRYVTAITQLQLLHSVLRQHQPEPGGGASRSVVQYHVQDSRFDGAAVSDG